ncbi:MAG: SLC13 family permease [Chitinophagales bacterium]
MTPEIFIVLVIALISIILFTTEYLEAEVTALLTMVVLIASGILSIEEGLSGFSHTATITVFALLVLSLGLQSTGLVYFIGDKLEKFTGESELRIYVMIVVVVGFLSAFMNNTAVVAIFMPVVIRLANYAKVSPSRFLMPLSFAAMLGGTMTIIGTSTNIIVSSVYEEHYGVPFGIFEFSLLGLLLFSASMVYMMLARTRLIPERKTTEEELTKTYKLSKYLTQIEVKKGSPMIGKKLKDTQIVKRYNVDVIEISREGGQGREIWVPNSIEAIREHDLLTIKANLNEIIEIQSKQGIRIKKNVHLDDHELNSEEAVLFEAVIGRNSFLVGKKIGEVDFQHLFKAIPLAIRSSGETTANTKKVSETEIHFGDVLLMEARRSSLNIFYTSPDFIVLEKVKKPNLRRRKMLLSTFIILFVVVTAAFNILPIVTAALIGCMWMILTHCLSMRYIYRKMDWRVFFLLAGILPLGIAVEKTGASALIANTIVDFAGTSSPTFIISILFLITTLLTSFMSNNATAVLLAPIAITIANQLGLDPKPFLVTVMFAASTSFLTPIGYQTNTLVYGAGNYTFMDFVKVGGLLTFLVWIMCTFLIPYLYL